MSEKTENIVCVNSKLESDNTTKIKVYIQNTETNYTADFLFYADSHLKRLTCWECEDGDRLSIAKTAAINHMNELREINRSPFSRWIEKRIHNSLFYKLTHRKEKSK